MNRFLAPFLSGRHIDRVALPIIAVADRRSGQRQATIAESTHSPPEPLIA